MYYSQQTLDKYVEDAYKLHGAESAPSGASDVNNNNRRSVRGAAVWGVAHGLLTAGSTTPEEVDSDIFLF